MQAERSPFHPLPTPLPTVLPTVLPTPLPTPSNPPASTPPYTPKGWNPLGEGAQPKFKGLRLPSGIGRGEGGKVPQSFLLMRQVGGGPARGWRRRLGMATGSKAGEFPAIL